MGDRPRKRGVIPHKILYSIIHTIKENNNIEEIVCIIEYRMKGTNVLSGDEPAVH
jgi:hypothetical protein